MNGILITIYAAIGLATGSFAAWETAKHEAKLVYPSPITVVANFAACAIIWPFVLIIVLGGSLGSLLIHIAQRKR